MKTDNELREDLDWSIREELAWLIEMSDDERRLYLAHEGGLHLEREASRRDIAWIALGVFYWWAAGVTDHPSVAFELGVTPFQVNEAHRWLDELRSGGGEEVDEVTQYLMTKEAIATYACMVKDLDDDDLVVANDVHLPREMATAVCIEEGLLKADEIAAVLGITPLEAQRAMNELAASGRKKTG